MATKTSHSAVFLFSFIAILFAIPIQAQVPTNQTFKFINQGELGGGIVEYHATYRVIQTNSHTFYTHPFGLCFYNTTPDSYIFAIRAGVPKDEVRWVWDANRNHPVREKATLSFGREGNLVLGEADGTVVWQTNTANKGVTGIKLLGNGNLVLHDKNGRFIWQSFDYPTDTLLLGQSVTTNGRNKLVSRKSDTDGSDGPYSIVLDHTGFTMYLNNTGQRLIYGGWTGTDYGSTVTFDFDIMDGFDDGIAYELVLNVNQDINAPPPPPQSHRHLLQVRPIGNAHQINLNKLNYNATYTFLRLGSDGNLKAYTYYDKVRNMKWEESFAFFSSYFIRECALPSKCGSYGYCSRGMCVGCPSPKGLLGWSKGCAAPKLGQCKSGAKASYYKVADVEHFLSPYLDGGDGPMKVGECRAKCDKDCKCLGFFYREDTSKCLVAPLLGTLIKDVNTSVGYIKYSK
ncbi:unnamed protein product [Malus baccata var. baccata]